MKILTEMAYPIEIRDQNDVVLDGILTIPQQVHGVVIFAHGSGSHHLSPRNQSIAIVLNKVGIATLLFDLLTADEKAQDAINSALRFDIALLSDRLEIATKWVLNHPALRSLPVGYFGSSTGAAAAMVAAARMAHVIRAVVSRGGRPDLADESLKHVRAATLFIVGSLDHVVVELNEKAQRQLMCENKIELIAGATHLFEEPGTIEKVAMLAQYWFQQHLR